MAVPDGEILTVDQVKNYLDIEFADHDTQISELILALEARFEQFAKATISNTSYTGEVHDGGTRRLYLKHSPVKSKASVSINDTQGTIDDTTDDETIETDRYRVDLEAGVIHKTSTAGLPDTWADGIRRFEVDYDAGLDNYDDWAQKKLALRPSMRRCVAGWYENQVPTQTRERSGPVRTEFQPIEGDLPKEVVKTWSRVLGRRIPV